jgi:hypothetical protein
MRVDLTKSFGFGLESESEAGFGVKSETESLNRFVFGFGQIPEVKYTNPKSFLKDSTRTWLQPIVIKKVS